MKTRIILMLALSTMIFLGCSKDSLVDPQNEITELEMNQPNFDTKAVKKTLPFHIKGIGNFEVVKPIECKSVGQINMSGESKEAKFGRLKTFWKNCTDFKETHLIKGMHFTETKEEIYFYSDESGKDRIGNYYLIVYYGGTGQFKDANGSIKLYYHEKWDTTEKGTYVNEGKGTLNL